MFSLPRDKEKLLGHLSRLDLEHSAKNRRDRWRRRVATGAQDPLTVRIAEKLRLEGMECEERLPLGGCQ
jgi:hypothetical protein